MSTLLNRLVSVLLLATFSVSVAIAGVQPIYECGTPLSEAGKYRLMNDLVNCPTSGIHIVGSDITLNLNGHSISCEANDYRSGGVVVGTEEEGSVTSNVTVRNGTVFNCKSGIVLLNAHHSKVTKIKAYGNIPWNDIHGNEIDGAGILLAWSSHNKITHNHTYGNAIDGIITFYGDHNLFKHNLSTDNAVSGIWADDEQNSRFLCNQTHGNYGGLGMGPNSTNNLVRGNFATGNNTGIGAVGFAWAGFPWLAIPGNNVYKKNAARDNFTYDILEAQLDLVTWQFLPEPDNQCLNKWRKNSFGTTFGSEGCFGYSVDLDDDVCALEDDDDDGDDDNESLDD